MPAPVDLPRRLASEALGSAALVATVVGSGIMARELTADTGLALLCNAIATGAMLAVLITMFAPVGGAHFNPAVTLVMALRGALGRGEAALYVLAQVAGALVGTLTAHAMYGRALVELGRTVRRSPALWLSEAVASFGLLGTILVVGRLRPAAVPWCVALFITAAYWFTASTSFANPAVALARALTDSFAGIRPADLPAFIAAELAGALAAALVFGWLLAPLGPRRTA